MASKEPEEFNTFVCQAAIEMARPITVVQEEDEKGEVTEETYWEDLDVCVDRAHELATKLQARGFLPGG